MRLLRNQMLAIVGHRPQAADALPPFDRLHPLIAASMGTADPEAGNAARIVGAMAFLSAAEGPSTRVDAT